MATAYSDEVAVGSYNRIRLRVEYSGTSASCHIEFRRTSTYTTTWGDDAAQITFNGQTVDAPYWYTGTVDSTWREIDSASGFTVPLSGGTFTWVFNNPLSASVLGCSGTITIGSQTSPPTGLSVSLVEKYTNGAKFNVSVSSYGNPSSASGRWIEAGISDTNSWAGNLRSANKTNTSSSSITVNNSSTKTTSLTIQPNTRYYFGGYAWNTVHDTSGMFGNFVTLAPSPTVTVGSVSGNSATINYSTVADGGYYNKTIQYSTDGGTTWQTGATVTGGSAQSGSFTIDNLPGGENTVLVRTNTTSGSDSPISITIEIEKLAKFYGPALRYKIVGGYTSSVNENMFSGFTAEGFMQSYEEKFGAMYGVPDHITVNHEAEDGSTTTGKCIWIYFDNGTRKFCTEVTASIVMDLNIWGMNFPGSEGSLTPDADTVTLNSIYYDGYKSKEVKKLYGSVKNYEGADGLTHERVMTDQPESIVDVNQTAFLNFLENSNLFKKDVEKYGEPQQLLCYVATLGSTHNVYVAGGYGQGVTSAWYFHASNSDWTVVASQLLSATGITLETSANLSASRINLVNPRYSSVSKKITKLYGSLNGEAKLVFKDES